ncbi:putative ABC exporter domain-containing protein [Clostridium drakei]|uniref:Uncharacterized protein n=1 Tax=Clostridium drakei TaxID=332101 RepID=A0A2U8DRK4_9CLOT|nr:putative ABC exporter domain-containing protein [Clostridium drakei]AWI05270.1 hypothetical protein B9W14_12405 [Clostridium drakei]
MKKTNIINDIRAIMYLKIMEFKNNIMEIFKHPIRAIIEVSKFVLPIIFAMIPFIFNTKKQGNTISIDGSSANIIGSVIMLLVIIIFFMNLYKAVVKYYPTQYSTADVNFLFTSPISSRTIYSFSIAKQISISLIGSLIVILPFYAMLKSLNILISDLGTVYTFIGIVLFIIVIKTLNFFLYSISKRFNIAFLIESMVIILIASVILYFGISLYRSGDIINNVIVILNGKTFGLIPIIGWTRELIMAGFTGIISVSSLMKMSAFVILMMFITIYFATDYYEEAIVSVERTASMKNKNLDEVETKSVNKKKVKNINITWDLKKEYAFLWKELIINKRKSKGTIVLVLKYVLFAVVGGIAGYLLRKQNYVNIISLVLIFSISLNSASSGFMEGVQYELRKSYIFLLPGKIKNKIFAINMLPVIKIVFRNSVIISFLTIFVKITLLQFLSIWVLVNSINLINLFTTVVMKVILPSENGKNILLIYVKAILELIATIPAVGVGVLVWYVSKKIEASIFIFGAASLLSIVVLLWISEALFKRVECEK